MQGVAVKSYVNNFAGFLTGWWQKILFAEIIKMILEKAY